MVWHTREIRIQKNGGWIQADSYFWMNDEFPPEKGEAVPSSGPGVLNQLSGFSLSGLAMYGVA